MKKIIVFLMLGVFCFNYSALASVPVVERGAATLATGSEWQMCGSILTATENSRRVAYVPMRRHLSGEKWDVGCLRKYLYEIDDDLSVGSLIWESSSEAPRTILRPLFDAVGPVAGEAVSLENYDENAAAGFGCTAEEWAGLVSTMQNKTFGAPYPAAMAATGKYIYVLTDDGMLCEIDKTSGVERWALILPCACARLKNALACSRESLPWLCAGSLTAEKDDEDSILIWGTYGAAARGVFCVDVTGTTPTLLWAREEFSDGLAFWTEGSAVPIGLGYSAAAPLVANWNGRLTAFLPSGTDVPGQLCAFVAQTGVLIESVSAIDNAELILSPVGLNDSDDSSLEYLICADSDGGVQYFHSEDGVLTAERRIDLQSVCGLGHLEFCYSPLLCSTSRGVWLTLLAQSDQGLVVAAAPARRKNVLWSETPWRGSGYGWWLLREGFSSPSAALEYDDLLYVLGIENGQRKLLIVDLTPGQLVTAVDLADNTVALDAVDGAVVTIASDGAIKAVSDSTDAVDSLKNGILYTFEY